MTRFARLRHTTRIGPGSLLGVALAASLGAAPTARAQAEPPRGPERRVVIDMEQDVIEGRLDQPDTVVLTRPTVRKFRTLIEIRRDFRKEVLASGERL
jgi:hypothetical protein